MELDEEKMVKINDVSVKSDSINNVREKQVAFTLSLDGENGTVVAKTAGVKRENKSRKRKKWRNPRYTLPDATSWPSDSDITVLRMKLCLNGLREKISIPGDGLHRPDTSSMVNLATLIVQSKPHLNVEEYLMPLSSWGTQVKEGEEPHGVVAVSSAPELKRQSQVSLEGPDSTLRTKLARFLRFYFCSCCKCLYNLENAHKNSSEIFME